MSWTTEIDRNGFEIPHETLKILQKLFPPVKCSVPDILVFCSLVKRLTNFIELEQIHGRPIKTKAFNDYFRSIRRKLPAKSDSRILDSLQLLGDILQTRCLFVLSSLQEDTGENRSYGFGPLSTREEDVMIPVWRPKPDPEHPDVNDRAMNLMTMLTLRCESGGGMDERMARVVGPAVCCTVRGTHSTGLNTNARPETPGEDWHSIPII